MNQVNLIGRLVGEPETKRDGKGEEKVQFRLAVQRERKNAQGVRETDYIPCEASGFLITGASFLSKGARCRVTGSMESQRVNSAEGRSTTIWKVRIQFIEYLEAKRQEG